MRSDLLEHPIPVREESLPRFASGGSGGEPAGGFQNGTVQVDYTVSTRGRVRNIRTEVKPAEFENMLRMVHREIRRRVFRPALVDGVPVESGNQVFRHDFYYTESELNELKRKKAAARPKETKGS